MRWISAAWSRSRAAACLVLWAWLTLVPTGVSAAAPPALSVIGNQLVAGGMPLQLRGVNRGAYTSCSSNAVYDATRPADLDDDFPDATETPAFWTSAAATFAGDANVLFDPISEIAAGPDNGPYYAAGTFGYTSADAGHNWSPNDIWSCWLNGCANVPSVYGPAHSTAGIQSLITTIRATGASNPIMVSSPDFAFGYGETGCSGSGANCWQDYTPSDPDHRLVVDAHLYDYVVDGAIPTDASGHADPSPTAERLRLADAMLALTQTVVPIAQRFPVVLGELGETDCDNADGSAIFTQGMLGELDALSAAGDSVGVLPWTWDSENDGSEVLGSAWQSPPGKYGTGGPLLIDNYTGQPTSMGRVYAAWLATKTTSTTSTGTGVVTGVTGTTTTDTTTGTTPAPPATTTPVTASPIPPVSTPTTTPVSSETSPTPSPTPRALTLTVSGNTVRCSGMPAGAEYTFSDAASGRALAGSEPSATLPLPDAYERAVVCSATLGGQSGQSGSLPVPGPITGSGSGSVRMVAVCPAHTAHGCRVSLTLSAGSQRLGSAPWTLQSGAFRTVTVALSAAGRRRLAHAHGLTATLSGTEQVGVARLTIVRTALVLRR